MRKTFAVLLVISMVFASIFANGASEVSAVKAYPTKPIKMLIPTKPGGDVDANGRLLSKNIEKYLGTTLVPVNVEGGGGGIAMQQVATSNPDGYTFFYYNYAMFTSSVVGTLSFTYKDFVPVVLTSKSDSQILVVPKNSPYQTIELLRKALVEKPGTVRFAATYGAPSLFHAVKIEDAVGGEFKKTEVSSGADKIIALLSGEIDVLSTTTGLMRDYVKSDKVTVLGSITKTRSEFSPQTPTFTEQGIDLGEGFDTAYVLYAHKDTPQDIIDVMVNAVKQTMSDETAKKEFMNASFTPSVMYGAELKQHLDAISAYYFSMEKLVKNSKF